MLDCCELELFENHESILLLKVYKASFKPSFSKNKIGGSRASIELNSWKSNMIIYVFRLCLYIVYELVLILFAP